MSSASHHDDQTLTMVEEEPKSEAPVVPARSQTQTQTQTQVESDTILTGSKLVIVFASLMSCVLLIALDQTIVATALPTIASDFHSFALQGWISSAFILAQSTFLLFWGQILRVVPAKYILLVAVTIFEVGSLVCGVAPNVNALIAGRAVSGLGAGGMLTSMIQVIAQVTRLEDRPRLMGIFGSVFALATVVGPLIGGAFTDHATWRWCFYLNLPCGGVALTVVTFLLKPSPPLGTESDPSQHTWTHIRSRLLRLDYLGAILVAGSVTTLILALQWGGNTKPWNSPAVIVCFVLFPVLAAAAIWWEVRLDERAMVPTMIFKNYSTYAIVFYAFIARFSLLIFSYYIPIFYQAARHHSAVQSGVDLLPFMLGTVLTLIIVGQLSGRTGYYQPWLVISPFFLAVGTGLLYSITPSTPSSRLVGYQILAGIGTGMGMQNALIAMQVEFRNERKLIAQASSMVSFGQFLGGTVGLGIAEPVFASELSKYVAQFAPDLGANAAIVKESPTAIWEQLPADQIPGVVKSYTDALRVVFVLDVAGVPVAGLGLIASAFIKNVRIEKTANGPPKVRGEGEDAEKGSDNA
ncbi:Major facilitator transporter-like protein [Mycena chlorophos]|uniref:Major facilitator transporter-like protein n=1 Tax=Mycena chlorophos TaxID=658473 RepID=A0A8H6TIR5_MYCCL|nr:Major facilitator transporter-like protein [Mycena chlorophos]